jgi:hypothetical protein
MGLVISKGLTLRKDYRSAFADPDVQAYLSAVEQADGQALEYPVAYAVDEFVRGCKADGIWNAIKASCILAGARTLTGALVPLAGTAPTSFNFVSGDYNRKTGLVGDGSTKYLDSNRNNNADPQNNQHMAVRISTAGADRAVIGVGDGAQPGATHILPNPALSRMLYRNRNLINDDVAGQQGATGLVGMSRSSSVSFVARSSGVNTTFPRASETPASSNVLVFARSASNFSPARLAFYSIGESLDLALLDARVTDLINAFGAAIP